MKTQRNILIAFLLNLFFSVFEVVGGIWTGSVAILSDALHDLGDALSIGLAFVLEKHSRRPADDVHTYGHSRYSVLGGLITSVILLCGSVAVIWNAVSRILDPTPIHYDGMILFAVVGAAVNLIAAFVTREGDSLNQKAVNLHMLEDVLGWITVLIGAVVMRFTDLAILDPILSIGVAVFIIVGAGKTLGQVLSLFLEETPHGIHIEELQDHLKQLEGVEDVHHIHIWSMDSQQHLATLHAVVSGDPHAAKEAIREELREHGIGHVTIELEHIGEECPCKVCHMEASAHHHHHHHHH